MERGALSVVSEGARSERAGTREFYNRQAVSYWEFFDKARGEDLS